MAKIAVRVVNNSGKTVGLRVEEDGEQHQYLKVLQRRGDLKSVSKAQEKSTKSAGDSGGAK